MQGCLHLRSRLLAPMQPMAYDALRHAEPTTETLLRKPRVTHPSRKQSGPLRKVESKPARVQKRRNHLRGECTDLATLSRQDDKTGTPLSDKSSDVPDHRSEKYRKQMEGVGRRFKFARQEAGWSTRELMEKSGVDKGQISRLERGENIELAVGRFFDLCDALALDPIYVWTGKTRGQRRSDPPGVPPPDEAEESGNRPSSRPKR